MSYTIETIGTYKGYEVFKDYRGFYIKGLNGLNQPKNIYRDSLLELEQWIDEQFNRWLGR
jgi:hypothetical protein